jgi:serine/threonine protein phosphatase PrpC
MLRLADFFQDTDTGRQRRANEDNLFVHERLFVVADGMGGARAGEVASQAAVEAFQGGLPDAGSAEERLVEVIVAANQRIHGMAQSDDQLAGMGTTVTAAWVGETDVSIAHVGDSRAYLWRDGQLQLLTQDHSLVNELVIRGKLTEEQAAEHPQRSIITRALGPEASVEVDTQSHRARGGDVYLLCSDGLTSMIGDDAIAEVLASARTLSEAGQSLIHAANEAGGRDNITVVLFALEDAPDHTDQPTEVGRLHAVDVGAAAAGDATRAHQAPAPTRAPKRTAPRAPRPARTGAEPAEPRRRRRGRIGGLVFGVVFLALVAALAAGIFVYARSHYFIGTDDQGFVTVYRGLDASVFGVDLNSVDCSTSVLADQVPRQNRGALDRRARTDRSETRAVVATLYRKQLGLEPGQPTPALCQG